MQQLSLWDAPETPQAPPGCIAIPDIGGTLEWTTRWANGDSSPQDLEQLARVVVGKLDGPNKATDGTKLWFRCIAAHPEGDHVVMTLQRIEPVLKGYDDWVREWKDAPVDKDVE